MCTTDTVHQHATTRGQGASRHLPLVLDVDDAAPPERGGGVAARARHGRVRRAAQRQARAVARRAARDHHARAGAAAERGVRAPHLVTRAAADAAAVQRGARRGGEEARGRGLGAVPARTGCTYTERFRQRLTNRN